MVRFYRVLDASTSLPCVSILSPTNGSTVSGLTNITFYATAIDRIKSTTLIVDGQPAWTITSNSSLPFPSYFFSNGAHTVAVQVTDNGNDEAQGIASSSITLNVQNNVTVTWYEAFGDFLPIQASLTSPNANYTVDIRDAFSNLVRTITGSTSNGIISTNWDGNDGSGVAVSNNALYFITLTTIPSGSAPQSINDSSGIDPVQFAAFKEDVWSTSATILEREVLQNSQWNAVAVGKVDVSIKAAFDASGAVPGSDYLLQHIQNDSDWTSLLNQFKGRSPQITQFYYTGHANGTQIGFKETTPNTGLDTLTVKLFLSNLYYTDPKTKLPVASFLWPYKFVFIDGCYSGTGDWMLAFGILNRLMDYSTVGRRQRAFIGWSSIQVNWLFSSSNNYEKFGANFWSDWIAGDPTVRVADAIVAAEQSASIDPTKLIFVGYVGLQWSY
jgi:hypothetical protein